MRLAAFAIAMLVLAAVCTDVDAGGKNTGLNCKSCKKGAQCLNDCCLARGCVCPALKKLLGNVWVLFLNPLIRLLIINE